MMSFLDPFMRPRKTTTNMNRVEDTAEDLQSNAPSDLGTDDDEPERRGICVHDSTTVTMES